MAEISINPGRKMKTPPKTYLTYREQGALGCENYQC
jgi:hypothetical protein